MWLGSFLQVLVASDCLRFTDTFKPQLWLSCCLIELQGVSPGLATTRTTVSSQHPYSGLNKRFFQTFHLMVS